MRKRYLLAGIAALMLAGCSSSEAPETDTTLAVSESTTKETVTTAEETESSKQVVVEITTAAIAETATEEITTEEITTEEVTIEETTSEETTAEETTTEEPTEAPTEPPTEAPTPAPTEPPTEAPTPAPTEPPTEAPTPAPTEPPTEAPTPAPTEPQQPSGGITATPVSYGGILYTVGGGPTVCIDPGHMGAGSPALEPNAPGSSEMKARATTGTAGVVTRIPESIVNLQVSLQLRDVLLARGYNVMMTRESQEVDISNMERAMMANENGATIIVRIHCNGVDNPDVHGVLTMSPSAANPYVGFMYESCYNLSAIIADSFCAATGAANKGVMTTDTMSGINWALVPVTIVEMGFMSNPTEDQLLCDAGYQAKMVQGIANGIDRYFGK